jgi:hypothetical protein
MQSARRIDEKFMRIETVVGEKGCAYSGVFGSRRVTSAGVVTDMASESWSSIETSSRAGLAPAVDQRLFTAYREVQASAKGLRAIAIFYACSLFRWSYRDFPRSGGALLGAPAAYARFL